MSEHKIFSGEITSVPEPLTLVLMGMGLSLRGFSRRRT